MSIEPEHLGWMIKRIQHAHHRALDADLASIGVTLVQWNALREIERRPGCSQHQLAEYTFNSDQAFGTLVTRLHARGWVDRGQDSGRATTHRLTAEGKTLLRAGQRIMSRVLAVSFSSLHRHEREQLAPLLAKILDAHPGIGAHAHAKARLPRAKSAPLGAVR